jgi:hypothetical protein
MNTENIRALSFSVADIASSTLTDTHIKELVCESYDAAPESEKDHIVAELVANVYRAAPLGVRGQLLQHLLKPLGVLSLVTVANGIFADILFRSGLTNLQLAVDDAKEVQASDVLVLVDYVQQVSRQAVNSLVHVILAEPVLSGSAAATILVTVLMNRAKFRRADDGATSANY